MKPLSLYIHIPFCRRRCPYCDFTVLVEKRPNTAAYVEDCVQEISARARGFATSEYELQTIYLGGGTPSMLTGEDVQRLIEHVKRNFVCALDLEITMECNPEDADKDFSQLLKSGVSRLSLGTQSFLTEKLSILGREHTAREAHTFISNARVAGFSNLSCDLIFATPGESMEDLDRDLQCFMREDPKHISTYELTIEHGTHFFDLLQNKKILGAGDEHVAEQMIHLDSVLRGAGYEHYEISNFAKPGFHSRHNSAYWSGSDYLGIGIGAHGLVQGRRYANVSNLASYRADLAKEKMPEAFSEVVTSERKLNELLLFGFRTIRGIHFEEWEKHSTREFPKIFARELGQAIDNGLCVSTVHGIAPTLQGMMVADALTAEFMKVL